MVEKVNCSPQVHAITGLTTGPMIQATVKLEMVIGLQIQGVLRFGLSQTVRFRRADLLLGQIPVCARQVSGWKS